MIKINENNNWERKKEIIKNLENRGYEMLPEPGVVYYLPYDITGRWKNYNFNKLSIKTEFPLNRLELWVKVYFRGSSFSLRLDTIGFVDNLTFNLPYLVKNHFGESLWDKYYDSLYSLVKPLGLSKNKEKYHFLSSNHSYTDGDTLYFIDDGVKKLVPRIKSVLQPPKRKGRF